MQVDRIAAVARLAGTVRGLGVCDVLRVELEPVQRAGLEAQLTARTAELEQRREDLEAAGWARADPEAAGQEAVWGTPTGRLRDEDEELRAVRDELRVLERVREGMSAAPEPLDLTGPAGLVLELVGACLVSAVGSADARLGEGAPGVTWVGVCERELEAAAAWIRTALDCRAVEAFCFDPDADPPHAW
jgi:hypothetical protein